MLLRSKLSQFIYILTLTGIIISTSGCATVFGGGKYYAFINVDNNKNVDIYHKGRKIGTGKASIKVPRREANKLVFTLKNEGCQDQNIVYNSRKVRGWALVGSIASDIFWFPFVANNVVDLLNGAYFKPNNNDPTVTKLDHRNYQYNLTFENCDEKVVNPSQSKDLESSPSVKSKEEKLGEVKSLFDQGIITEEEYKEARSTILKD